MKNYLCSAFILLAMVSCDSKKEAVKPSYKTGYETSIRRDDSRGVMVIW